MYKAISNSNSTWKEKQYHVIKRYFQ